MRGKRAPTEEGRIIAPARTPEEQEDILVNLSMQQAERMLRSDKPPAQVVVHFLKLGTAKYKYDLAKLNAETKVAEAKAENIAQATMASEKYAEAMDAFRRYTGEQDVADIS